MALIKPTLLNIWLLVLAMNVGRFLRHNFLLFGQSSGEPLPSPEEFRVYDQHAVLDYVLGRYKHELGPDFEPYRNHCLRVLSFAVYHRQRVLQEDLRLQRRAAAVETKSADGSSELSSENMASSEEGKADSDSPEVSVSEDDVGLMAWALAYHDIALWTDGALSYLEPSVAVMERDWDQLVSRSRSNHDSESSELSLVENWLVRLLSCDGNLATAREIVLQHHKYTSWKPNSQTDEAYATSTVADAGLVNAVRQADWADATMGVIRFGLPGTCLEAAYVGVPPLGFHRMLVGLSGRLSPPSLLGRLDVLKILKW